jgi:para-nitrobenzyl esterase
MRYVILCLAPLLAAAASADVVRVEGGELSGIPGNNPDIRVFKGIPYAQPPIGDLRWRAPKPLPPWAGVRAADKFSNTCIQMPYAEGSPYRAVDQPVSEDCLYLNVWTPAKSNRERHPVMVWIHGGALTRGSGSLAAYDGEEFAKKGVVLVTLNYRLGIFGFYAHPELTKESDRNASGNYGILDQVAALEWVQKNVGAFGGDPKRVTIFGESAGSWCVNVLTATPLARGLFQRAIGESGALFSGLPTLAEAEQRGAQAAKQLGAGSIAEMREKSAADLMKARVETRPVVDGWLLPQQVMAIYAAHKQNEVPLLIGSNANEGTVFTPAVVHPDSFREMAQNRFGDQAAEFLKIYPASDDEEARQSSAELFRDQTFGWEMRTWARMAANNTKAKIFVYYFSRVPPGPFGARLGAYHAAEIPYVFGHMRGATQDLDNEITNAMSSYWVNFAMWGDPNHKDVPRWPAYHLNLELAMSFSQRIQPTEVPNKSGLDFLDAYFQKKGHW